MGYKLLLLLRAQQQLWVKRYFVDVETQLSKFPNNGEQTEPHSFTR